MTTKGTDNNLQPISANFGPFTCIETQDHLDNHTSPFKKSSYASHVGRWVRKRVRNACSKKMLYRRVPILEWLPKYDKFCAVSDFIAGITIGLTVIPQALAYAILVGLPPQYGLYSSFLCCFVYIIFGSCKDVAIGPTAIVAMLTFDSIKGKGPEHAILLCFLTGMVQVVMGLFGLGFLVDFISGPVCSGFTSAGALYIVSSQLNILLGVPVGSTFLESWKSTIDNAHDIRMWDAILGTVCLVVLIILREIGKLKIGPKDAPSKFQSVFNNTLWFISISRNAILVVICGSIGYYFCENGTAPFKLTGFVPAGLPKIQLPSFSYSTTVNGTTITENFLDMVSDLGAGIIVVPLLALLENISVCKCFSKGKSVDATQELLALGLSNLANSFVQSFPGTGAMARSALNNASGVRTTLGGLYTGILVIITLLFLTPYFYYIPKTTLAAIIMAAAVFMVDFRILKPMWRAKKSDLIPGLATFIGCLTLPLSYGIIIGVGINLLFILYHAARPKVSLEIVKSEGGTHYLLLTPDRCLIFPSVHYVRNLVTKHSIKEGIPVVIDCSHIYGADYTAATVIKALIQDFLTRKQSLFFYNLKPSVSLIIDRVSPTDFVVYYDKEDFDEMLKTYQDTHSILRF